MKISEIIENTFMKLKNEVISVKEPFDLKVVPFLVDHRYQERIEHFPTDLNLKPFINEIKNYIQ